jgi:hypothetical protein
MRAATLRIQGWNARAYSRALNGPTDGAFVWLWGERDNQRVGVFLAGLS